jgi:hypothetical protein
MFYIDWVVEVCYGGNLGNFLFFTSSNKSFMCVSMPTMSVRMPVRLENMCRLSRRCSLWIDYISPYILHSPLIYKTICTFRQCLALELQLFMVYIIVICTCNNKVKPFE